MIRSAILLDLLLTLVATPAMAQPQHSICRETAVVAEMTREIRARNYYIKVDPALITEQPTSDPLIVRCQVCVEAAPYNMTQYGEAAIPRCQPRGFEVRALRLGFVVRYLQ